LQVFESRSHTVHGHGAPNEPGRGQTHEGTKKKISPGEHKAYIDAKFVPMLTKYLSTGPRAPEKPYKITLKVFCLTKFTKRAEK
jgi:hypothetical protein